MVNYSMLFIAENTCGGDDDDENVSYLQIAVIYRCVYIQSGTIYRLPLFIDWCYLQIWAIYRYVYL